LQYIQKVKIVIDNKIPFINGALEPYAEVVYKRGAEITKDDVKDADALIVRTRTKCNAELLEGSSIQFIATATIGFDHIDTQYCKEKGIEWTNAKGCNSSSVLQYIFAALVRMEIKHRFELKDKTIGIVGVGSVGTKVARFALALGMKVLLCDPFVKQEDLINLYVDFSEIKKADIITFHVPLSKDGEYPTYHLAGYEFFESLSPNAIVMNSSRGEVVDGSALKSALQNKKIQDSVIDVWEHEPNIDLELLNLVGIATPHIAGYSLDGKATGTEMSIHALAKFFDLPLLDWRVQNLPFVKDQKVALPSSANYQDAIAYTYPIHSDDERLRNSVSDFELQRETYPVRREFSAYQFVCEKDSQIQELVSMGFNAVES